MSAYIIKAIDLEKSIKVIEEGPTYAITDDENFKHENGWNKGNRFLSDFAHYL